MRNNGSNGFTLIELLIVVAIIGILAAIAVPNFLNAQVRAKVSRVFADLRSLGNAIEMYTIDNNTQPGENCGIAEPNGGRSIHTDSMSLLRPYLICHPYPSIRFRPQRRKASCHLWAISGMGHTSMMMSVEPGKP